MTIYTKRVGRRKYFIFILITNFYFGFILQPNLLIQLNFTHLHRCNIKETEEIVANTK